MKMLGTKTRERGAFRRWLQRLLRNQHGALLMEVVITLSVFGLVGTAALGAVQTSSIGKRLFDEQSTAENVVRNQIEYVLEQDYKPPGETYLTITPSSGYSVTAETFDYNGDPNIEIVRFTVNHQGQPVKVFEIIRTDR